MFFILAAHSQSFSAGQRNWLNFSFYFSNIKCFSKVLNFSLATVSKSSSVYKGPAKVSVVKCQKMFWDLDISKFLHKPNKERSCLPYRLHGDLFAVSTKLKSETCHSNDHFNVTVLLWNQSCPHSNASVCINLSAPSQLWLDCLMSCLTSKAEAAEW